MNKYIKSILLTLGIAKITKKEKGSSIEKKPLNKELKNKLYPSKTLPKGFNPDLDSARSFEPDWNHVIDELEKKNKSKRMPICSICKRLSGTDPCPTCKRNRPRYRGTLPAGFKISSLDS